MSEQHERLLRRAYEAFNARDIEGALATMHTDVDWPNAMEGGRVHGHAEVREARWPSGGLWDTSVSPSGRGSFGTPILRSAKTRRATRPAVGCQRGPYMIRPTPARQTTAPARS